MNTKDPAFLFYSSDFLSGTFTMTNEQIGKYIRLLCIQHQKCILSEKDMLNICGTYDEDIYCKFKKENNVYYNERLRFEAERRKNYAESRRNNRKKTENDEKTSKDDDMNNICKSYDEHMETETENENINVNKNEKKQKIENLKNQKEDEKFNFKNAMLNNGFDEKLTTEWLKVRSAKKAVNTETAFNNFLSEVKKTDRTPNEILKIVVENSWKGFNATWLENINQNYNNGNKNTTKPIIGNHTSFGKF